MKDYTLTKRDTILYNMSSSKEMNEQACVLFATVFNSGLIGVLCILGLAGNIMSLTILHSDRQNRVASFLLQALAVADTAVLIISCFVLAFIYGILHSQTTVVAQGWVQFIHKYVNSLGYSAQGVTIWFTVLLAINRYVAVCRPLHANRLTIRGAHIQAIYSSFVLVFFSFSLVQGRPVRGKDDA